MTTSVCVLQVEGYSPLVLDPQVFNTQEKVEEALLVFKSVLMSVNATIANRQIAISGKFDVDTHAVSGAMFVGKAVAQFSDLAAEAKSGALSTKITQAKKDAVYMEVYSRTMSDPHALQALRDGMLRYFGVENDVPF